MARAVRVDPFRQFSRLACNLLPKPVIMDDIQWPRSGRTADSLVRAVMLDIWPTPGAVCDYGIDSQEHYEALYYPIKAGEITADQLHDAVYDGKGLTELARNAPSNPHPDIEFAPLLLGLGA